MNARPKQIRKNHPKPTELTVPALKRLADAAGIERVGKTLYPATRKIGNDFLTHVLRDALILMDYRKKKTISVEDVEKALERVDITVYK